MSFLLGTELPANGCERREPWNSCDRNDEGACDVCDLVGLGGTTHALISSSRSSMSDTSLFKSQSPTRRDTGSTGSRLRTSLSTTNAFVRLCGDPSVRALTSGDRLRLSGGDVRLRGASLRCEARFWPRTSTATSGDSPRLRGGDVRLRAGSSLRRVRPGAIRSDPCCPSDILRDDPFSTVPPPSTTTAPPHGRHIYSLP